MTPSAVNTVDPQTLQASLDSVVSEYIRRNPRSREMHQRAQQSLPGGNTRAGVNVDPFPIYADYAESIYLHDLDGHCLLDFVNNATSLILGHSHPAVVEAIQHAVRRGTAFSRPVALEVEMAELLKERMPAMERVRFCSSGTEAVLNVLRVARAFTGKFRTAKFEGAYHGIDDHAMVSFAPPLGPDLGPADRPNSISSTEGLTRGAVDDVLVLPFNDGDACERLIDEHADELATVIVDPLSTAAGLTLPTNDFLQRLRDITQRHGILLLFDEIVSFRVHPGGAHSMFGVRPDLICLGKVVSGGTPAAVFGGRADVMALFDPTSGVPRIWQSGTFNANPISLTAGLVTLRHLTADAYERLGSRTRELANSLQDVFDEFRVPASVVAIGSLMRVYFLERPPVNYREAARDSSTMHRWLFLSLLNREIYWRNRNVCAVSLPMAQEHIDRLVTSVREILSRS